MTTNKPLFVMGLAGADPAALSSSRSRRKTDGAAFADLMEVRGPMAPGVQNNALPSSGLARPGQTIPQAGSQADPQAPQAGADPRSLQSRVFGNLSRMFGDESRTGGLFKSQGLIAMRNALTASSLDATIEHRSEVRETAPKVSTPITPQSSPAAGTSASAASVKEKPVTQAAAATAEVGKGIPLTDRRKGIPIQLPQKLAHNVAMNRNRPTRETASADEAKKTTEAKAAVTGKSPAAPAGEVELGKLAAQFESGSEGIAAIGYDRNGGTSYGKYQIASRPGSMAAFISFLGKEAPDLAKRLKAAGPANTGSRRGEMPRVWKEIASEAPERFEELQEHFIRASHYEPALAAVRQLGYNTGTFSPAMKEVLWSTAVQHGPTGAARIFRQAAANVGSRGRNQERQIIREVYDLRAERFGSSSPQIQAAARKRMEVEKHIALAMADKKSEAA